MALPPVSIVGAILLITAPERSNSTPRMTITDIHHGMRMSGLCSLRSLACMVSSNFAESFVMIGSLSRFSDFLLRTANGYMKIKYKTWVTTYLLLQPHNMHYNRVNHIFLTI